MSSKFAKAVLLPGLVLALSPFAVAAQTTTQSIEQSGTTPYVTHFIFRPVGGLDIPDLGKVTVIEATGTTENMKGEPMFDDMSARCSAVSVESGESKYIDGACALTDKDGDRVFSTFDTRELDKSQPEMDCGTHFITAGTGKYKGITGKEPFKCIALPAPAGEGGLMAMDIEHNTTWEIGTKTAEAK